MQKARDGSLCCATPGGGLKVDAPKGQRALWVATCNGCVEVVEALLADPRVDLVKSRALEGAAACGQAAVVQLLLLDPWADRENLQYALDVAACAGSELAVQNLLRADRRMILEDYGASVLRWAVCTEKVLQMGDAIRQTSPKSCCSSLIERGTGR